MNIARWNMDQRPGWLDELPEEAPAPAPKPDDGFQGRTRIIPKPCSRTVSTHGTARHWQFHPALLTPKRVLLPTFLCANGPTRTVDMCQALGFNIAHLPLDLRRLQWVSLVGARRVPGRVCGTGYPAHFAREWSITDRGRQALWRLAWVTRDILFSPWEDVPLRDDVESDPVEAVRRHVVFFWLRPNGLQVARTLISPVWSPISMHQITMMSGINNGTIWKLLQYLRDRGWLREHWDCPSYGGQGNPYPRLSLNQAGIDALGRHVDALRRAGRATNWTLDPNDPAYDIADERGEFPYCWEPEAARHGWNL